jgi:TolA-binding protein
MELTGIVPGTRINDPTVARLEDEIKRVRETSNQYDLSIQHTLEDIQQRLDSIERKGGTALSATKEYKPTAIDQPEVLKNGQG